LGGFGGVGGVLGLGGLGGGVLWAKGNQRGHARGGHIGGKKRSKSRQEGRVTVRGKVTRGKNGHRMPAKRRKAGMTIGKRGGKSSGGGTEMVDVENPPRGKGANQSGERLQAKKRGNLSRNSKKKGTKDLRKEPGARFSRGRGHIKKRRPFFERKEDQPAPPPGKVKGGTSQTKRNLKG